MSPLSPSGDADGSDGRIEELVRWQADAMARIAGRLARLGAWSVDLQRGVCRFSDEVCSIHELPPGTHPSLTEAFAFYPAEAKPLIEERFNACVRLGTPYDLELDFITATGRQIVVRAIGEAVRDAEGRIVAVQGALQDISERKHAEHENRALAERLATTLESITDGFFTLDGEGRFSYVNHQAELMLRRARAELLGRSIVNVFPDASGTVFSQNYRRALEKRVSVEFEGYYASLKRWFEVRAFPHEEGLAVYFRDVTSERRARENLARSNRALQLLSRCNEALVRAENEQALLETVCQLAIEVGGYRLAWVGYAIDDENRSIEARATAGHAPEYAASLNLSWSESAPAGRGPAGRTIRTGQTSIVENLDSAEYFKPWAGQIREAGLRGMVCLPLNDGQRTFGMLAIYFGDIRSLPAHEVKMLQEMADNLAFGIATIRARLDRKRTQEAVLTMARGLSAGTGFEFFHQLVRSLAEALGADAACLSIAAGSDGVLRSLAASSGGGRAEAIEYSLAKVPRAPGMRGEVALIARQAGSRWDEAGRLLSGGGEGYAGALLHDGEGRVLGLLHVQFRRPVSDAEFVVSTLQIYAARTIAELERERVTARTREQAALLDKAQDAILVRDLSHRITYWNKSAERLYGWTADEAVGRVVRDLLYTRSEGFDSAMEALSKSGEWVGELDQVRKDGQPLTIEGRWTLVRDDAGQPVSVLAINTDITDRKRLETQFLRAQRMESIGTLAGGIAHDLNNLLAPITMGVDLLKRTEMQPDTLRLLGTIERSARRGADLVRQVLSFARGVEGMRVAVQVAQLVRELEIIVRNTFPKNVRFEARIAPEVRMVLGDPTQLNQVLLNLCVNARDAMPHGGQLTLSVQNADVDAPHPASNRAVSPGQYVVFEVTDTGVGMAPAVLERIFEPFYTTKEVGKGTGLGLSTVLGIVRSHGGFVNVRSESGRGSTFTVHLPACPHEAASEGADPDPPAGQPAAPRGRGETILVVDDEAPILEVTRETLEAGGYRVLVAEDGVRAVGLYAVHRARIAAVITDMMMPVMDGNQLINALRRIEPGVRVIAASGLSTPVGHARAATPDTGYFLAKPYSAEAMLVLLDTVLRGLPPPSGPPFPARS